MAQPPGYAALISAWNGTTQPPTGVTGSPLSPGNTTQQNIDIMNAWTIVGTIPASISVTGNQLANCINFTEFNALTTLQQQNLVALCQMPGLLLGGSGNTSLLTAGMFINYFTNHSGPTITALTALATSTVTPWWQSVGLANPVTQTDITAAGLGAPG